MRSRCIGVADVLDVPVESDPSSLCFLKASTHGVLTRMLVKSLYTPSVLGAGVTCKRRSAGERRGARITDALRSRKESMGGIRSYQKVKAVSIPVLT